MFDLFLGFADRYCAPLKQAGAWTGNRSRQARRGETPLILTAFMSMSRSF